MLALLKMDIAMHGVRVTFIGMTFMPNWHTTEGFSSNLGLDTEYPDFSWIFSVAPPRDLYLANSLQFIIRHLSYL
jgi:hypothetical protein